MKTLVLVSCGQKKSRVPCKVKEMYTSTLFKAARAYAEKFGDYWYVLSARAPSVINLSCGWLDPEEEIEPYDRTLKGMGFDDLRQWVAWCQADFSRFILEHPEHYERAGELSRNGKIVDLRVVMLAGESYVEPFRRLGVGFANLMEEPLHGLQIGERVQWLQQQVRGGDEPSSRSPGGKSRRPRLQQLSGATRVPVGSGAGRGSSRRGSDKDPHEPI